MVFICKNNIIKKNYFYNNYHLENIKILLWYGIYM